MNLISFDIGIKNMAYCIFSINTEANQLTISSWNTLNLMNAEPIQHICTCVTKPKSTKKNKTPADIPCKRPAKYQKNGVYYCDKHAKANTVFLLPNKQCSPVFLKKQKVEDLFTIYKTHITIGEPTRPSKKAMLDALFAFFSERCFDPVAVKKTANAGDADLITIGRNMKTLLNQIPEMSEVTHVIIENQISPIANRMKTIQGMLAQYYIMRNSDIEIEFVSSSHKLKQFTSLALENTLTENEPTNTYKQHKQDGVYYCTKMIESNPQLDAWKSSLNTKKKDDLADSFLQGIWYLKHRNILLYADDLKINLI